MHFRRVSRDEDWHQRKMSIVVIFMSFPLVYLYYFIRHRQCQGCYIIGSQVVSEVDMPPQTEYVNECLSLLIYLANRHRQNVTLNSLFKKYPKNNMFYIEESGCCIL